MAMSDRPVEGVRFNLNTVIGIVQLVCMVVGGVVVFMELKGDVRVIQAQVDNMRHEVDRMRDALGVGKLP